MARTPPIKAEVLKLTRAAIKWTQAAVVDVLRDDRIDALDALRMAAAQIDRASERIRDTLPRG